MKPRLFVGSSRESVALASAVHANLDRVAEVTTWDADVFKPSVGTLDSLLDHLNTDDFGVFIFAPDDLLLIRGDENRAVRDNVVFELGVFVGRLGRDRSFFICPRDFKDFRIPSDLLGLTPLEYEAERSDDNFVAATKVACSRIAAAVVRQGVRRQQFEAAAAPPGVTPVPTAESAAAATPTRSTFGPTDATIETTDELAIASTESSSTNPQSPAPQDELQTLSKWRWLDLFVERDYEGAVKALDERIALAQPDELPYLRTWRARARGGQDPEIGKRELRQLVNELPETPDTHTHLAYFLSTLDEVDEALEVLERGEPLVPVKDRESLVMARHTILESAGRADEATTWLRRSLDDYPKSSWIYGQLAATAGDATDQGLTVLEAGLRVLPNDDTLLSRYAAALEVRDFKLALGARNKLIQLKPSEPTFLTLRANLYLKLGFSDLAMGDYRHANDLAKGQQGWIVANIGNLLNNVGLHRDAIVYFKEALKLEPEAQYTHERLAGALARRNDQVDRLRQIEIDARRELAAAANARRIAASAPRETEATAVTTE